MKALFDIAGFKRLIGILTLACSTGGPASYAQPVPADAEALLESYRESILIHHDAPVYVAGDLLRLSLFCFDRSNGALSGLSRVAYVELLDASNEPVSQIIVGLQDGRGEGKINLPLTINSGNYRLRAYTRWMRNFPPEEYAHANVTVVNPFKPLGIVAMSQAPSGASSIAKDSQNPEAVFDKDVYGNRELVTLALDIRDNEGNPTDGAIAISVAKVPDFYRPQKHDSEQNKVSGYQAGKVFLPEVKGQLVEATVTYPGSGLPAADELVYLSVTGKLPGFYTGKSNKEGIVRFEVLDFYGPAEIHLQPASRGVVLNIQVEPPFSSEYASLPAVPFFVDESWRDFLTQVSQDMQVRSVYADTLPAVREKPPTDTLPFYGLPDQRYFLDDYTRFPLTEEVLREYVAGIMLRKRDGSFYFKMVDMENRAPMADDPLILYDGLPVAEADRIVEIDPRLIKRIDVITRKFYMGAAVFHGVASFHTYDGDLKGLDKKLIGSPVPFMGLQFPHEYSEQAYGNAAVRDSPLPDFRSTLLWVPQAEVKGGKAVIEFFTGDDTGTYLLHVKGVAANGRVLDILKLMKVE